MLKYYFLIFIALFFVSCSNETEKGKACENNAGCEAGQVCNNKVCHVVECTTNDECSAGQTCLNNYCYDDTDPILGEKKLQIIGNPSIELISGETASLKIQLVRTAGENTPQELVGPIPNEKVTFSIVSIGENNSTLTPSEAYTDEAAGMVTVELMGINDTTNDLMFNVEVSAENANKKTFSVVVYKRTKTLKLVSDSNIQMYVNSNKNIIAQLTTNNNYPYDGQTINFSIVGSANGSSITDSLVTDITGMAVAELTAGETPSSFTVKISSQGSQDKSVTVIVKERSNGCLSASDCEHLGENYVCNGGACVYDPPPCQSNEDCPENFECDNGVCKELPYVCNVVDDPDCRCITDANCPQEPVPYTCSRGFCVRQDIACTTNTDCPAGLVCKDRVCSPLGTECKADLNCPNLYPEKCPTADSCICQDGFCVNPCPNADLVELSGGSGAYCTGDKIEDECPAGQVCCDADFEMCFNGKCVVKWDADQYFHLIEALPPTLQTILNGISTVFGPVADALLGELDLGLPGWLSWLEETIIEAIRPYIDQYIPRWVQDLIIGINDTVNIMKELKIKSRMSFTHKQAPDPHSYIQGIETWDIFYIKWKGRWTEVKPNEEEDFQFNSSSFNGNIKCQLSDGTPKYMLYIDRHSAEFKFGKFVKAFLNNVLIPAVTRNEAHSLEEALDLFIDCNELATDIMDFIRDLAGDFAEYLGDSIDSMVAGQCENLKDVLVSRVDQELSKLSFGGPNSDSFTFDGFAPIETKSRTNLEGKTLGKEVDDVPSGKYNGTLNLDTSRNFSADWKAVKDR